MKQWVIAIVLAIAFGTFLPSCVRTQGEALLDQAKNFENKADYPNAVRIYEKVFKTSSNKEVVLLSAYKAQELSYLHTKDYRKALKYLEYYIANTGSFSEAQESLKRLAYIEHKLLNLYEPAIRSYHRLLNSNKLDKKEEHTYRLEVARCHYAINEFDQAVQELETLSKIDADNDFKMSVMMLKANVFQSQNNTKMAVETMDKALALDISDANKKDVSLNKAIILEHQELYREALAALEAIKAPGDVIEDKKEQLRRLAKFQRSRKQ
ncbi:MAG: tetratricopeptide repeat protein [Bdellovibrionaceae bacterium]|nr:tetratricopeptide repeat protein [Pseudobdellovibrionaceae bacterium]